MVCVNCLKVKYAVCLRCQNTFVFHLLFASPTCLKYETIEQILGGIRVQNVALNPSDN